jgi:hypothetical protein
VRDCARAPEQNMADEVMRFLDQQKISTACLVGHSLGVCVHSAPLRWAIVFSKPCRRRQAARSP